MGSESTNLCGWAGKRRGVKLARSLDEVRQFAEGMLNKPLITHQTGSQGQIVHRLYIEQGVDIQHEFYLGMVIDRTRQRVCLMASAEGGMDIEEVAAKTPEKIHKILIDPVIGLTDVDITYIAGKIGLPITSLDAARELLKDSIRRLIKPMHRYWKLIR